MRVRTEAKRAAIVATAARLFRELGYERTSMAMISAELGGSKATLYGYFPSKELLFVAVIQVEAEQQVGPSIEQLESRDGDLPSRLQRFGEGFLTFLVSPDTIAGRRMVIAEAGRSDIGRMLYETGPHEVEQRMAAVFASEIRAGRLKKVDARLATLQFHALLEAETLLPSLMGLAKPMSKREIRHAVARAVATFVAAYASPAS